MEVKIKTECKEAFAYENALSIRDTVFIYYCST